MWLVPTSGGPISAGTFHTDEARHADPREVEVPVNIDPKAFAVTMEPAGGVSKPTVGCSSCWAPRQKIDRVQFFKCSLVQGIL